MQLTAMSAFYFNVIRPKFKWDNILADLGWNELVDCRGLHKSSLWL